MNTTNLPLLSVLVAYFSDSLVICYSVADCLCGVGADYSPGSLWVTATGHHNLTSTAVLVYRSIILAYGSCFSVSILAIVIGPQASVSQKYSSEVACLAGWTTLREPVNVGKLQLSFSSFPCLSPSFTIHH